MFQVKLLFGGRVWPYFYCLSSNLIILRFHEIIIFCSYSERKEQRLLVVKHVLKNNGLNLNMFLYCMPSQKFYFNNSDSIGGKIPITSYGITNYFLMDPFL